MKIGVFAKRCGVPASSIRYWVKVGKLMPALKTDSDYMLFTDKQIREVEVLSRKKTGRGKIK